MRFINCPNCLSSHSDRLDNKSTFKSHRKRNRLFALPKALFSPIRNSFDTNKSKKSAATKTSPGYNSGNNLGNKSEFISKYCLERKHKVKKRDLVGQRHEQRRPEPTTGN